jgi:hypothetical protein
MAFPHSFISMANFELAFTRVVRGQTRNTKTSFGIFTRRISLA